MDSCAIRTALSPYSKPREQPKAGAAKSGNLGTFSESINDGGDVTGYFYAGANAVLRGFLLKRTRNPSQGEVKERKKTP